MFFHKNPYIIDTVDGVALRIGSSKSRIQKDLDELVDLGILGKRQLGKREMISLNAERDKQIQQAIASHADSLLRLSLQGPKNGAQNLYRNPGV